MTLRQIVIASGDAARQSIATRAAVDCFSRLSPGSQ